MTVFDNSPRQLDRDRETAEKHNLAITLVEGDMRDLSVFEDDRFDIIVHPISNVFVPDVRPVYAEAYRTLAPGGRLMTGFMNPLVFIFHKPAIDAGRFEVRYSLPYSDLDDMSEAERIATFGKNEPLEWSHTVERQISGQIEAGFMIGGFYEDTQKVGVIKDYFPAYFATLALKPSDATDQTGFIRGERHV